MRYFGGRIGHLKNTPPQQVPINPSSEEMAVDKEDDDDPCASENEDLGTIDDIMISDELEVTEDHEDDHDDDSNNDGDEGEDQTLEDEDEDSGCSGDEEEYGYATP
jgi:hypothetical protein